MSSHPNTGGMRHHDVNAETLVHFFAMTIITLVPSYTANSHINGPFRGILKYMHACLLAEGLHKG